ncbi:alg7 dolichyl-phosphate N-acetylglucosaminephosphotransferase [Oratosquilla oratoria]|uniref:alg7 dolichyl-phosphate N-acetylglucosaminephosphotransferase n=1 Tax=Oratosquilla oratoria TaxID=337810 RepID=UPI003F75DDFE
MIAVVMETGRLLSAIISRLYVNSCCPPTSDMLFAVVVNLALSVAAVITVVRTIPAVSKMFIGAGLYGRDMNKKDRETKIPEGLGVITGCVFLIVMFLFLGVPFGQHFMNPNASFPHSEFSEFLTSLLSICCMLFLGFADDVLNLKWRYKVVFPTLASLPLLMVYYINFNSTTIVVPKPLRVYIGMTADIGPLYYLYMALLAVFCTNAINIYSGINGLEVGQSLVISASVIFFNLIELGGYQGRAHAFSLYFMLPFTASTLGLFYFNKYPARVFVGDTFCYFAGMTFAVVAIIGHFSKTLLLFFIPQILNFLYSTPQLFRLLPCPRHRLPRYDPETNKVGPSCAEFKASDLKHPVLQVLRLLHILKLVHLEEGLGDGEMCRINNLTLINFILIWTGPQHEGTLTKLLLVLQVFCTCIAFFIRYPLASFFYD